MVYIIGVAVLIILLWANLQERRRHKVRLRAFKLNMARIIHDEVNPSLLLAKALVKTSDLDIEKKRSEISQHLDYTMELVRGLSQDLKSNKQYNLNDLVAKTDETLQKLTMGYAFRYRVEVNRVRNRFLSHYQYTQLIAVLNECISNTIKHASFEFIEVSFVDMDGKLQIHYKDDGKGWNGLQVRKGIGLENIQERIIKINGDLLIDNDFPNGYQISISMALR